MSKTAVILDSNYFLHFLPPEAIKWREYFSAQDKVTLLVIPPVVAEIDRKKWDGKSEFERNRAKDITSKFKSWFHEEQLPSLSNGITIERLKANNGYAVSTQLSPDDQILEYASKLKSDYDKVIILTHDFGLQDKSKDLGLEYLELPDTAKRKGEVDILKKELLETQKELRNLKNRVPKLKIQFRHKKETHAFLNTKFNPATNEEFSQKLLEMQTAIPLLNISTLKSSNNHGILINGKTIYEIDKEKWEKYNENLNEFYTEYTDYLRKLDTHLNMLSRTIEIELNVENYGSAPASEIQINLNFSSANAVEVFDEESFPKSPEEPLAPKKPDARFDWISNITSRNPLNYLTNFSQYSNIEPSNMSGLIVSKNRGFDISFNVRSLKHLSNENIEKIFIVFPSAIEAASFQIEWKALSNEMPTHDNGYLTVLLL